MLACDLARFVDPDIRGEDELDRLGGDAEQLALAAVIEAPTDEQGNAARGGALGDRRAAIVTGTEVATGEEQRGEVGDQALKMDLPRLASGERLVCEQPRGLRVIDGEGKNGVDANRHPCRPLPLARAGCLDPSLQANECVLERSSEVLPGVVGLGQRLAERAGESLHRGKDHSPGLLGA